MIEIQELINLTDISNAIVAQAYTDYRDAIRGNGRNPKKMLKELKRFFESDWYETLTKVDYRYLIHKADIEWEDGKKLIEVGGKVDCTKLNTPYAFKCPLCGKTAKTIVTRVKGMKRKDGTRRINYYKSFSCSCHSTEKILLKQEVIT